jgi:hypothetical protein
MRPGTMIRIWLIDEVEPEGGFWCYGKIDDNGYFRQDNFNYYGKEDQLCHIDEFKNEKIEVLWQQLKN